MNNYYQLRYQQGATTTTERRVLCTGRMNKFATAIRSLMDEEDYQRYRAACRMTIFDLAPMSYWRRLYRTAHYAWLHLGRDTPRSVCELTLLREVNRRLRRELAACREGVQS